MKTSLIIALVFGQMMLVDANPDALIGKECRPAPKAWLGVRIVKPDRSITAHIPSLPDGVGFVVLSTDAGGPAEAAGVQEYDVIWKLGDQMLVNESQLAALLRLAEPGKEVVLSGFRGGKPIETKLTLGHAPAPAMQLHGDRVTAAGIADSCESPMRIINLSEKTASFTAEEGRAEVRRSEGGYQVQIRGVKGEGIFDGRIVSGEHLDPVPEAWRPRVVVLCRTLDQALEGGMMPTREPRPRVIPEQLENP